MSKWLGLFALARRMTRKGLRILCYHGFALSDEAQFLPELFMSPESFRERLAYLKRAGFPVLPLQEAVDRLRQRSLPYCATVITIDDGFYGTIALAASALKAHAFPATVYVTTYYALKGTPIFRLVIQYAFWRTQRRTLELRGRSWADDQVIDLTEREAVHRSMWQIINHGENQCTEKQRVAISEELCGLLGVEYERIAQGRILSIIAPSEIRQLADKGCDVQLHTHRHRFPDDDKQRACEEIRDNRRALEAIVPGPFEHFCYPSGVWAKNQWQWLMEEGIRTATTCDRGFNYPETPRYGLMRLLDADNIRPIEFQAEMCGFLGLLRLLRTRLVR